MIKNKKGAGHVDWTISIGIFIIFLLSILVFIKPVYKPAYESETLGEIIKDSFLETNSRTIYRTLINCVSLSSAGCDHLKANFANLGEEIYVTNQNFEKASSYKKDSNSILLPNLNVKYWAYYNLKSGEGDNGNFNPTKACGAPIIGETTEYTGLKSTSITNFQVPNFPATKEFNLKIRDPRTGEIKDKSGNEPPDDVDVYVYEFVYPVVAWKNNQPEKINYIVSIQIW